MSRMEEYFPKPEEYHPERWLRDERAHLRTSWSHESGFLSLGFSHGLRACPGRRFAEQGLYLAVISVSGARSHTHRGCVYICVCECACVCVCVHAFRLCQFSFIFMFLNNKKLMDVSSRLLLQILRKYRLEYHDDEIGMIHMPFTTPDRPLNIKFVSRNQ